MWGQISYIVLGAVVILVSLLGKRFYAGLTPRTMVPVTAWQGRTWLLFCGILIFLIGVAGFFGVRSPSFHYIVDRGIRILDLGYELFGGLIVLTVGTIFLFPGREKVDRKTRLLALGMIFCGIVLLTDGLRKFYI
jgi:hypothetical protein